MNDLLDGIGWVLWAGTLGLEGPVGDRVEAALACGCSRVSISPLDVMRAAEEEGVSAAELGRRVRHAGLEIVLDPVTNWYGTPFAASGLASVTADVALRMGNDLEAVSVNAIGQPRGQDPEAELPELFARVCDRAADFGARVQLEFMPMMAIADLASAWAIVSAADRTNGGLLLDTWGFFRSTPDFALLAQVPGDRIFAVQVADAPEQVGGSLGEDRFHRLLPGDGSLDLPRLIYALDDIGALQWVGPEVISPTLSAMAPCDAARIATDRVQELIARVRSDDDRSPA